MTNTTADVTEYLDIIHAQRDALEDIESELARLQKAFWTTGNEKLSNHLLDMQIRLSVARVGIMEAVNERINADFNAAWKSTGDTLKTLVDLASSTVPEGSQGNSDGE